MISEDNLRLIFHNADLDWVVSINEKRISWFVSEINREISEIQAIINTTMHQVELSHLMPVNLQQELLNNTVHLKAFIQSIGSPMTLPIKAMTYFLVEELADLQAIDFSFETNERFEMSIVLEFEHNSFQHTFHTNDLWDMEIFQHVAYMKMGDRPILSGYLPINKTREA